jgi:asparagine synthase
MRCRGTTLEAMWSDNVEGLESALRAAVRAWPAEAVLLSGGLDSSVLAALAAQELATAPVAITVGLVDDASALRCERCAGCAARPPGCGADLGFAEEVARALGLDWEPVRLSVDEALRVLDDLIRAFHSFDLGLLNDIPILAGMARAAALGHTRVWTGDDADTLFGGYRFLREQDDWGAFLRGRVPSIRPQAEVIAPWLGRQPVFPYLHPDVIAVAQSLTRDEIETPVAGRGAPSFVDQFDDALMNASAQPWGKAIVRFAAERVLPADIAWRPKTDLQFGAGMCRLETPLAALVDDEESAALARTGLRWFNRAHMGMYRRFTELGLAIRPPGDGEYACVDCGAGVAIGRRHCGTCGAWPADQRGEAIATSNAT